MTLRLDLHCQDTICAPATPTGRSALSIVRVSGPDALSVREKIFSARRSLQQPFVATLGDIIDGEKIIDEAVCVFYPDSRSFTGEPCFELSVHGNPVIVQSVLSLLQNNGCRPAGPGEFSLRAVLHGKIDLAQAESIADIIDAQSPQGVQVALRNLKGGLEKTLLPIRTTVLSTLCEIEARLDFPDEGIGEKHKEQLVLELQEARQRLSELLAHSKNSSKLLQGFRIVLFGKPNVGKSTLLNALVGEERCIVHETPGTTRDVLEVSWQIDQIPALLIDVAGIRDHEFVHPVEAIGIERAKKEFERADLVLCLIDSTDPDAHLLTAPVTESPMLKIFTKGDLLTQNPSLDGVLISAKTRAGLDDLVKEIRNAIARDLPNPSEVLLTRLRHVELVRSAEESLMLALDSFKNGYSDEVVAFELREVGRSLDELLGKSLNEEVLDLIFSRFCIGK